MKSLYSDVSAILDGPNGPPILESLLAEHDAETAWCAGEVHTDRAA
ncbi:hypothetical protein [Tsukamurella spumae]|uniref:Uncharacterized protein n=1 Tax=Tsukamurella spumae TaxID=44753 RepID=A0A846X687_9ACTN|nr:hypothetical protein [Tsukamurella spumae]NKY21018.1 hypothetical protein [Tsukamurella spumae]